MKNRIISGFLLVLLMACKKDSTGGCWECRDFAGNVITEICADSEDKAVKKAGVNVSGNPVTKEEFRRSCTKK